MVTFRSTDYFTPQHETRRILLGCVVVAIAILGLIAILYLPALHYSFQFDDEIFLRDGNLRSGRLGAFLWPPVPRLVAWISFAGQFHLSGEDPAAFRLFNVRLHAVNSILVFLLILLVSGRLGSGDRQVWERILGAALGAVVFAVHPLAIEPVVYVYQRSTLLASAFALGAMLLWVSGRGPSGRDLGALRTSLVAAAYGLAVASKEFVILLPGILWCYDWLLTRQKSPRREVYWVAAAGVAAAVVLFTQIEMPGGEASGPVLGRYLLYPATQVWAWWRYLFLTLFPVGLNVDHHLNAVTGLGDPACWLGLAGLAALAILFWRWGRKRPPLRFWIAFYALFLLPTSSLVPSPDFFFEHRVYASLAGYGGLVALGAEALWRREGRQAGHFGERALIAVLALGVLFLIQLSLQRRQVWESPVTLWRDSAQRSPAKYRPNFNAGIALMDAHPREARLYLSRAIEINAGQPRAYRSLAQVDFNQGDLDSADRLWRQSLLIEPAHPPTLLALAKLHIRRLDYATALRYLEAAAKAAPKDPEIRYQAAALYLRLGFSQRAIEQAEEGLSHHPEHVALRVLLADAVAVQHNWSRAAELYQQTLSREPSAAVFYRLAKAYRAMGETHRAVEAVRGGIEAAKTRAERLAGESLLEEYGS